MNGADVADQLRSYYNTQQTTRRNWMPLFFWLLNMAIINAYRIIITSELTKEHKEFHLKLVWDLVNFANDTGKIQLRNSTNSNKTESKKEIKQLKTTKHFEISDK
ncbi:21645_t:CDS:1 [Cetraspora pellucida]|uniref:21645_t:CDS:1 n=1 Tax=Cetraspora pellucida TaxID=1433469 RepID=A0A9N9KHL0_9GLOM|nr:21645_t:CDS:1 [Cetraspora pellucida]